MKVILSLLLVIFSLIGISDASYLTYEKYSGIIPPCTQGFQCETVLTSKYAQIGPVPLSVFGLLFYLVVFTLSILHFTEFEFKTVKSFKNTILQYSSPIDLLQLVTIAGFIFSIYLVFLMGVVIKAWCLYCLVSALSSTMLFFLTQLYVKNYTVKSGYVTKTIFHTVISFCYVWILKPIFFSFNPEFVHESMTKVGAWLGSNPITKAANLAFFAYVDPSLSRTKDGITFPNPIGLSAGYDYNGDLTQIMPAVGFGWQTIGTVTLERYDGNPKPWLGRFPNSKALLVNKGLKNLGAEQIIKNLRDVDFAIPVGFSIASTNKVFTSTKAQITDIIGCFKLFEKSKLQHSFYELNISCPNTFGGEPFTTPERLQLLLTALDTLKITKPVYIKMPIDQSEKETLALLKVIDSHNIQGVILGNLTKDKTNPAVTPEDAVEWKKRVGNLSGKPTFERSNRLIALTKKHYKKRFTIIGTGGVFTAEDAQKKFDLGADLVQLITGMIYQGPQMIGSINRQIANK